jgi:hypothetical protein
MNLIRLASFFSRMFASHPVEDHQHRCPMDWVYLAEMRRLLVLSANNDFEGPYISRARSSRKHFLNPSQTELD